MKIRSLFAASMAAILLASCSQEENLAPNSGNDGATAYLSLNMAMPQTMANAGPNSENATVDESALTNVYVYTFDSSNAKLDKIDVTAALTQAGGVYNSTAFKVSSKTTSIFVVCNPTAKATTQMDLSGNISDMSRAIDAYAASTDDLAEMTTAKRFMMTSAGATPGDHGLTAVSVHVATSESAADIAAAKAAAEAAKVSVSVDRAMAKIGLLAKDVTVENGEGEVVGMLLSCTNTKYFPYAELTNYSLTAGGANVVDAKYRIDPNFSNVVNPDINTEFKWLKNPDTYSNWTATGETVYSLENTMEAKAQNHNNTEHAIIKAVYTPNGIGATKGDSWYRVNGTVYNFTDLKALYAAQKAINANSAFVKSFDAFAHAVLKNSSISFDDTSVTEAALDAVPNGGWEATKISALDIAAGAGYLVEYYQHSLCYYKIMIKHDNRVAPALLGRWGVVRNNYYTLNVSKIMKPGQPYIPDPTDPDIIDPENPDPDEPDPDDEVSAYLAITITVNPWTAWVHDTVLGE